MERVEKRKLIKDKNGLLFFDKFLFAKNELDASHLLVV